MEFWNVLAVLALVFMMVIAYGVYRLVYDIMSRIMENNEVLSRIIASKDYHHFVVSRAEERRTPERSGTVDRDSPMSDFDRAFMDPMSIQGEDAPIMNIGRPPNPPQS